LEYANPVLPNPVSLFRASGDAKSGFEAKKFYITELITERHHHLEKRYQVTPKESLRIIF
jgi:hypothetical protein